MDLNSIKLDARKLTGGVWWAVERLPDGKLGGHALRGDPGDRPALLIRPVGVDFERALEAARRPYLIEIRERRLPPEIDRQIVAEAIAEALWIGAQGLTVHGEPFSFDRVKAAKMLADPAWLSLSDFILSVAGDRAAALADEEAKALGNS